MDKFYEFKYHKLEKNHWWFASRRNIILKLINKLNINKNVNILEIGCSGGPLIKALEEKGFKNITGIDLSANAINICKKNGITNVFAMNGEKTFFSENKFDLIIASDILEHIKNDNAALAEWHRILKPMGMLIIFVPAYNFLWSSHDIINHHFQRYSKLILIKKLHNAGFQIERSSYWNLSLFFPTLFIRTMQKIVKRKKEKTKDQLYELNPFFNYLLITLLKIENLFLTKINFPFGISTFAICKKRSM